jgi:long-chain acyl-CoA synthetase
MQTLIHPMRRAATIAAEREGIVCEGVRRTFGEFASRARRLHTVLEELGTRRGDRVASLLLNSHALAELYCAVPAAGRLQVPLNFRWAPPELAYALQDAGAKLLFTDRDPGPLAEHVERVIRVDTGEYDRLVDDAVETPFDDGAVTEDDTAGLFYTGGTTGASKGVMLSHRNLLANATGYQQMLPMSDEDVYLVVAPMFHAAGSCSVLQCLYLGVKQVLVPRFTPGEVLDAIEREGVTHTLAVPSMLAAMAEEQLVRPRKVGSLRAIAHGGSPVAIQVLKRAKEAFPAAELVELYGATETSPLVTVFRHEEEAFDAPHATAGRAAHRRGRGGDPGSPRRPGARR